MKWISRLSLFILPGFIMIIPNVSNAQQGAEIIVQNETELEEEIPGSLKVSIRENNRADASVEIISWFTNNAWLDAEIDSVVTRATSEKWYINSGCRYTVESADEIVIPDTLNFSGSVFESGIE